MKRIYFIFILLFGVWGTSRAQESTENYIRTRTMLDEQSSSCLDEIMYYDGLGRPYQKVQKGITTNKQNLISLQEYDAAGREYNAWLPIASSSEHMTNATFKSTAPGKYENDSRPYSQPVYEASALNRPIRQYGPGVAWKDSPVSTAYLTNDNSTLLCCIHYGVDDNGKLALEGNYTPGQLFVTRTIDEDGNVSCTFIDKLDRKILIRQMNGNETHDTYYVYDRYSNLRFVLQPMYQKIPDLNLYAFQYKYDGRNRCNEKKMPGSGTIKYVNDKRDNLVFSQDSIQRSKGEWTFYLYDVLGRLTVQGTCKNTNVESAEYSIVECTRVNAATGLANSGYSSSFALNSPVLHLVNYYDDYNFRALTGFNNSNFPAGTINAKGLLTGSVITVLDSNTKLYSANYYDKKGRMIKDVSSNLMGGYETINTVYTFTGKPATVTHVHTATGNQSLTEMYTYKYDHAERLSKVEHTLNGKKVTLTDNTYNDLSRLETKSLHNSFADIMGYKYNIRGWLTNIDSNNFILKLNYGYPASGGNIASMFWKSGEEGRQKYTFTYDGLGRMLSANHLILGQQDDDDDDWGVTTGLMNAQMGRQIEEFPLARENAFTEKVTEYDKNGNILKLVRYGQTGANSYGVIDNLTMTLTGNQLNRVDDASTASAYDGGFEFKDAVKQDNEYVYDANGNLTQDLNKGIEDIQYNCLNLPRLIKFKDQSTITYTYAADGTKLRVEHKIGSSTTRTTYCSNVIYEGGTAKCLLTEEGYVSLADQEYHYYLKDHQGNNRVMVNKNGGVEEINHYYPFGGVFASEENVQPYKYNGKELDTKKGLNWYDYGARQYDAALGRWHVMDSSSEKYYGVSSYAYCNNNPVKNIDLDGRDWYIYHETGELYFNSSMNQKEIEYNNRSYVRIGGNDMLGDMKDIVEQAYNFEESLSLANTNGYSINPIQEIQSEISREQSYSAGKYENTLITGEIVIVNEQYDIFSIERSEKKNIKTETLLNPEYKILDYLDAIATGAKKTDLIERNYFTYSKPTLESKAGSALGTIYNVMEKMTGKHDYRNVNVYKSWNEYSNATKGIGRMLPYRK